MTETKSSFRPTSSVSPTAFGLLAGLLFAGCGGHHSPPAEAPAQGPFEPNWESLTQWEPPQWFADAKFGIYWHWGLYSVPAYTTEHYVRRMYHEPPNGGGWQGQARISEYHRAHFGDPSAFGYKDFIPLFTAEKFDADEWADLIVRSGARFAGPVGLHHDRFPMWESDIMDWNAATMGPRRDLVGELEAAIRQRKGLKFLVSLHHDRDWTFYGVSYAGDYDTQDPRYACTTCIYPEVHVPGSPPNEAHMQWWADIVREVVDKYEPDLIWFDGALNDAMQVHWGASLPRFREHLQETIAYYYNRGHQWGRDVAMTYKHNDFEEGSGILDIERGRMSTLSPSVWLTDTALQRQGWAYRQYADYKPVRELITVFVDIVSKNGSMLLNIGPRPDGTIPPEQQGLLLAMGEWLEMNGEAIYGTRPWGIHGEGPTENVARPFAEANEVEYTAEDIRFTTKDNVLYVTVLDWPRGQATVRSLRGVQPRTIQSVSLLGSDEEIRWEIGAEGMVIHTPIHRPGDHAYVYRVAFEGDLPQPSPL
jgi:alpha-L-fucosidase